MLLRKKSRDKIREVARQEYVVACQMHDFYSDKSKIAQVALKNARKRLRDSPDFGGILHAFLLSLATRLLKELIQHWIDENLTCVKIGYQSGEPGNE